MMILNLSGLDTFRLIAFNVVINFEANTFFFSQRDKNCFLSLTLDKNVQICMCSIDLVHSELQTFHKQEVHLVHYMK